MAKSAEGVHPTEPLDDDEDEKVLFDSIERGDARALRTHSVFAFALLLENLLLKHFPKLIDRTKDDDKDDEKDALNNELFEAWEELIGAQDAFVAVSRESLSPTAKYYAAATAKNSALIKFL